MRFSSFIERVSFWKNKPELEELGFREEKTSFLSSVLELRFWLRETELLKLGFRMLEPNLLSLVSEEGIQAF